MGRPPRLRRRRLPVPAPARRAGLGAPQLALITVLIVSLAGALLVFCRPQTQEAPPTTAPAPAPGGPVTNRRRCRAGTRSTSPSPATRTGRRTTAGASTSAWWPSSTPPSAAWTWPSTTSICITWPRRWPRAKGRGRAGAHGHRQRHPGEQGPGHPARASRSCAGPTSPSWRTSAAASCTTSSSWCDGAGRADRLLELHHRRHLPAEQQRRDPPLAAGGGELHAPSSRRCSCSASSGPNKAKGVPYPRGHGRRRRGRDATSPRTDDPSARLRRGDPGARTRVDFLAFSFTHDGSARPCWSGRGPASRCGGVFETHRLGDALLRVRPAEGRPASRSTRTATPT